MSRALVGARVSVMTGPQTAKAKGQRLSGDNYVGSKVSHDVQIASATRWAEANGCQVVGQFEDLGVSASIPPHERDGLKPWLNERLGEWDVIVWSKMDRAFRSTVHALRFAEWAEEQHKMVVFADDGLKLDYRRGTTKGIDGQIAEMFLYIGSFFAQLELTRFSERTKGSHQNLRQTTRWASAIAPYGYRSVPHPSGKGRGLEVNPETAAVLHEIATKLVDEKMPFTRIVEWLNNNKILTNLDRSRISRGEPPRVNPWNVKQVKDMLTHPRTQGIKTHQDKPVLDDTGNPIQLAPPIFTPDRWKEIQAAVELRTLKQRVPHDSINFVLGVGYCAGTIVVDGVETECGKSLAQIITPYKVKSGEVRQSRHYRCSRTPRSCRMVKMPADMLEELLSNRFLELKGKDRVTEKVFVPGEDRSYELEQVKEVIARLQWESDTGLLTTAEDKALWQERMKSQITKRDELAATPVRAAGYEYVETDRTYEEAWPDATMEERRELLVNSGIRFRLWPSPGGKSFIWELS